MRGGGLRREGQISCEEYRRAMKIEGIRGEDESGVKR